MNQAEREALEHGPFEEMWPKVLAEVKAKLARRRRARWNKYFKFWFTLLKKFKSHPKEQLHTSQIDIWNTMEDLEKYLNSNGNIEISPESFKLYKEYNDFLMKCYGNMVMFSHVHNIHESQENIDRGIQYREALKDTPFSILFKKES